MISKPAHFLIAILCCFFSAGSYAADTAAVSRLITGRDGLPQSYVSGIYQDSYGFLWTATLNGLGRYDGRQFKHYLHTTVDSAGLSGNSITHVFDAGNNNLLVAYLDGKIDKLNTVTEKVTRLSAYKGFKIIEHETNYFKSLVQSTDGICWMMATGGGIYRINLTNNSVNYLSPAQLKINGAVLGLAAQQNNLLLFTQHSMFICNATLSIVKKLPYPFKSISRFNMEFDIYSPGMRANGDLLLSDAAGIKIWNPTTGFFKAIPLKRQLPPGKLIAAFDKAGNYYFEYNSGIYLIDAHNNLVNWHPATTAEKGLPTVIYIDRSGVLWVGTNGFGLRQYNLQKTGMPGFENKLSFMHDVITHYNVPPARMANTLVAMAPQYSNRVATFNDSVWISYVYSLVPETQLALFTHGEVQVKRFFKENTFVANDEKRNIRFVCFSRNGVLWGIDQHGQLMQFNTRKLTYRLYAKTPIGNDEEVNGMAADDDGICYISTTKNLLKVNAATGHIERLTTLLPANNLLTIGNDPDDKSTLWIGTMSDGLIRFDKKNRRSKIFSIATGLPNNTIYSVLFDKAGLLWCSSNKGIFAFNRKTQTVRSFTSKDGLPEDEFNRYHYMQLPGGDMAFGGSVGYTIFNPARLKTDGFDPQIAITGLNVINKPQLSEGLNTLKEIRLQYYQNFISVTFAAMQFDFPEKNRYRYRLMGLDKGWITPTENTASYTSLPPGNYTLILNATNTSGKWSKYTRQLHIVISPPFWKTWWFYLSAGILIAAVIYIAVTARIRSIKKAQAQKLQFERKAMELHTMALRARMNPHFIFNCLNSIKALIQEKHDKNAIAYLTTFSVLIRNQLNNTSNEIPLREELETCKLYLELEAMRFDGRIAFRFDVENDDILDDVLVPPLILQPVIENAIVHGLLPLAGGGRVNIKVYSDAQQVICEIEDNGIGRAASAVYKQQSSRLHQSKGLNLLEERITMHNHLGERITPMQTIDLFANGKASGTLVVIKFNLNA